MHRFDESLPRIMRITPSGKRAVILFATQPHQGGDAGQRDRNIARSNRNHWRWIGPYYLRSSAACGWASMSLIPDDLAAASDAIIGRPLTPPSFPTMDPPPCSCYVPAVAGERRAGDLATTAPDILTKSEVARAIEEALVEAMILCLTQGHADDTTQCPSPPRDGHAATGGGPDVRPR